MTLYIFYLCLCRGGAPSFEAHELAQDSFAYLKAGQLLREHPSCDHVEVWDDDRPVLARHREEPTMRAIVRNEARQGDLIGPVNRATAGRGRRAPP